MRDLLLASRPGSLSTHASVSSACMIGFPGSFSLMRVHPGEPPGVHVQDSVGHRLVAGVRPERGEVLLYPARRHGVGVLGVEYARDEQGAGERPTDGARRRCSRSSPPWVASRPLGGKCCVKVAIQTG